MESQLLIGIASIIVLGIGAQWISWRLQLPSILMLLIFGFLAGPVAGLVRPDAMFGEAMFPLVSISVGLILFEGGMDLKFSELKETGRAIRNLITLGALTTWTLSSAFAVWLLDLDFSLALLLGAILIVTGPTVIIPMLRQIRPGGPVGSILKWEGILIDPLGGTLALLVFEGITIAGAQAAAAGIALAILKTLLIGGALGALTGFVLTQMLKRYWIPDFLHSPMTLMLVVGAFSASNLMQHESGLLTATVMGMYLANQRSADVRHILEFKENLRVLLIAVLFIVLAARLELEDIRRLHWNSVIFVVALIAVVRPAAAAISTVGTKLNLRERAFLAAMAPRGIVAAAVASIFAIRLSEDPNTAIENAEMLAPLTFIAIVGTVAFYGLLSGPIAHRLGVARPNPQGVLIVGAHAWARKLAEALQQAGFAVRMADTNRDNIRAARLEGLPTFYGNVLSEHAFLEIDLGGLGRMMALTPNDQINSLTAMHFSEVFGRSEVYQLPVGEERRERDAMASHLRGRELFGEEFTFANLSRRFSFGAEIKTTGLSEEYTWEDFRENHGKDAIPLMLIDKEKRLRPFTVKDPPTPQPGQSVISMVPTEKKESSAQRQKPEKKLP